MQTTYAELAARIRIMTEVQSSAPFKLYHSVDSELHPFTSEKCILNSRLVLMKDLSYQDPDYACPHQMVIEEYLPKDSPYFIYHLKDRISLLSILNPEDKPFVEEELPRLMNILSELGETPLEIIQINVDDIDELDEFSAPPYKRFYPSSEDIRGQLTYAQLLELIDDMTDAQRMRPVKFWDSVSYEIFPRDDSFHPEYGFDSKLAFASEVLDETLDDFDPDQIILHESMSEEGSNACELLYSQQLLLRKDLTDEQRIYHENVVKELGEYNE